MAFVGKGCKTGLRIKDHYLFVVTVAVIILFLSGFSTPTCLISPKQLVLVPSFGNSAFATTHWKGDSIPKGMAISLISLLWASLHSSLRRWLLAFHVRGMEGWNSHTGDIGGHFDICLHKCLLPLLHLVCLRPLRFAPTCVLSGRFSSVVPTPSTSPIRSLHARSRSPSCLKRPLVHPRPRGHVSSLVAGASPGSLSARCV